MDWNMVMQFVKPELLLLIAVVWGLGLVVKASKIENRLIPLVLCVITALLAALWVYATSVITSPQELAMAVFVAVTQGVIIWLVAWVLYDKVVKPMLEKNNNGLG